ncbi:hypothetical protein F2P81_014434 [Scophthalmus maximus]|uniref:Uncharacterized protein n=1 Tax=Scophthalmus maximus TaxID=52904 RepID=A0A6A4SQI1_SCOMX|nr:hypothetical protein F2P81_014434 [Scophthalmus maximus]
MSSKVQRCYFGSKQAATRVSTQLTGSIMYNSYLNKRLIISKRRRLAEEATGRVVNALPPVDGSRPARTNQEENVRGSFANGCFPVVVFPDADVPPPRSAWRLGGILNHKQIPPVIRPLNLTVLSRRSSAGERVATVELTG